MSDELLKRAEAYPHDVRRKPMSIAESIALVNDLAARVRELEARINELDPVAAILARAERAEVDAGQWRTKHDALVQVGQKIVAERDALRRQNERLRVTLQRIAYTQHDIGSPPLRSIEETMRDIARAALAQGEKPC